MTSGLMETLSDATSLIVRAYDTLGVDSMRGKKEERLYDITSTPLARIVVIARDVSGALARGSTEIFEETVKNVEEERRRTRVRLNEREFAFNGVLLPYGNGMEIQAVEQEKEHEASLKIIKWYRSRKKKQMQREEDKKLNPNTLDLKGRWGKKEIKNIPS